VQALVELPDHLRRGRRGVRAPHRTGPLHDPAGTVSHTCFECSGRQRERAIETSGCDVCRSEVEYKQGTLLLVAGGKGRSGLVLSGPDPLGQSEPSPAGQPRRRDLRTVEREDPRPWRRVFSGNTLAARAAFVSARSAERGSPANRMSKGLCRQEPRRGDGHRSFFKLTPCLLKEVESLHGVARVRLELREGAGLRNRGPRMRAPLMMSGALVVSGLQFDAIRRWWPDELGSLSGRRRPTVRLSARRRVAEPGASSAGEYLVQSFGPRPDKARYAFGSCSQMATALSAAATGSPSACKHVAASISSSARVIADGERLTGGWWQGPGAVRMIRPAPGPGASPRDQPA
jgi:hypothetical protein